MTQFAGYTEPTYKVCNRQKYDIGVRLDNGRQYNIKPGSFALLTATDIQYIESICTKRKFFASHMLEVEDKAGNVIDLENLNIVDDPAEHVLTDDEITAALKKSVKQVENWLADIDDPVELHAIYTVATGMDLPTSKLKVLRAKMPEKDWFDELE